MALAHRIVFKTTLTGPGGETWTSTHCLGVEGQAVQVLLGSPFQVQAIVCTGNNVLLWIRSLRNPATPAGSYKLETRAEPRDFIKQIHNYHVISSKKRSKSGEMRTHADRIAKTENYQSFCTAGKAVMTRTQPFSKVHALFAPAKEDLLRLRPERRTPGTTGRPEPEFILTNAYQSFASVFIPLTLELFPLLQDLESGPDTEGTEGRCPESDLEGSLFEAAAPNDIGFLG